MAKAVKLDPTIFVIFGITGDLSRRKLLASLYQLIKNDVINAHTEIIGITRRDVTIDDLLDTVELCVNEVNGVCDPVVMQKMRDVLTMHQMDLDSLQAYNDLRTFLANTEAKHGVCMQQLFYLSIPPQVYMPIIKLIGESGLNKGCAHNVEARLLVEKPFGNDLASAEALIAKTEAVFSEEQIYRIDHYLAKKSVRNIIKLRSLPELDAVWNSEHIQSIQITASETLGIEGRTTFYETTGALRDFIQNHLMQVMSLIVMDMPKTLTSEEIHQAKVNALEQIRPLTDVETATVRGQYAGYREEVGNMESNVETFAAVKLNIESTRWQGVPIILSTGKRLERNEASIKVKFKADSNDHGGELLINIQPNSDYSVSFSQECKLSVAINNAIKSVIASDPELSDNYGDYERVLIDAARGEHSLFAARQEILNSWRVLDPVIKYWARSDMGLQIYKQGSNGPDAVNKLLIQN